MKMWKEIRKKPVQTALVMLLLVQVCLTALSNIVCLDKNLDCDTGKLFNHIAEIWRQKQLILPGWLYFTTLEWDCSSVLALPFYAATRDIVLSFGLANIVFLICFIAVIFFLFQGENCIYPLLCANLLLIPYRIGMLDYYNMLFFGGSQYIIKVMLPLMLVGLLLAVEAKICGGVEVCGLQASDGLISGPVFSERRIQRRLCVCLRYSACGCSLSGI